MDEKLVKLEQIRAEIVGESFEALEAVRYLDAAAWYVAEYQRKQRRSA